MVSGTARLFGTVVAVLGFFASAGMDAYGGDILRLKAGITPLDDVSKQLFSETLNSYGIQQEQDGYFVIQFTSTISRDAAKGLTGLGLITERYLPDDALLVRGSKKAVSLAKIALKSVRAVAPFRPEWKVSPDLLTANSNSPQGLLVSAIDSEGAERIAQALDGMSDVRLVAAGGVDFVVEGPLGKVVDIAGIEGVEWVQAYPQFELLDFKVNPEAANSVSPLDTPAYEYTGYESGTKLMGFDGAWSRGFHGEGQVVAVADTGLDTGLVQTLHADLKDNFKNGFAVGLGSATWNDPNAHGTHVAGSIVGTGKLSDGHLRGGAYGSKLVMMGCWSSLMNNISPPSDMTKLAGYAYTAGARIHSDSWGGGQYMGQYDSFAARIDGYMWSNPDMLFLFASGNSGQDLDKDGRVDEGSILTPGTAKNVLTVGASENLIVNGGIQKPLGQLTDGDKKWPVEPLKSDLVSDNPNGLAGFSSRGPTKDGRIKPEIVAPGSNIVSTRSHDPKAGTLWGEFDANYLYAGGTSMSTPLTAGAAAVVRQFLVKRGNANPSAAIVKATLIHTATDLYPGQFGTGEYQEIPTRRPNVHEGYGRVDVDAATALDAGTLFVDDAVGVAVNEEKTIGRISPAHGLRVTMTYTDAPAAAAAAKALVNDIDLKIVAPDGTVITKADRVNNTEMVELSETIPGVYRVVIFGVNVPQGKNGKQPFAAVITGW